MNLARASHVLLYVLSLPWDLLIAWPWVLLVRLFWGEDLRWENRRNHIKEVDGKPAPGGPVLAATLSDGSWPVNPDKPFGGWYEGWGGTAVGHGVMFGVGTESVGTWTSLEEHEIGVHVEQFEASMFQAFMVAVAVALVGQSTASSVLALILWFTGFLQMLVSRWVAAWWRGEDPYTGSAHEEAAYAVDEAYERTHGRG